MRSFKTVISILLIVSLCSAFASCAQSSDGDKTKDGDHAAVNGGESPGTTGGGAEEILIDYESDGLPDNIDFGGAKVIVLGPDSDIFKYEILTDELNSEPVNDSVFNRQKYVEDRLNVVLEETFIDTDSFNNEVAKQHASGDNNYQMFAGSTVWFAQCVFDGYLTDLYEVDYLDFSRPWWSGLFIKEAEVGGRLFLTTGSLALTTNRFIYVMFYNKRLTDDYSSSIPELGDIYNIVNDGKWTYDMMRSLAGGIYEDLNGNSEKDAEDLYGFNMYDFDAAWSGFDMRILGRDEDGWLTPDLNEDKVFDAYEKLRQLVFETEGSFVDDSLEKAEEMFAGGLLMFAEGEMKSAETPALRNMADEYGLIPFPKYDEAQKNYYSGAHDQYVSFSIPVTNPDPGTTGAVMEAMASFAYRDTVPKYLDIALKGKYMSDAYSRRMVDLITGGFRVDAGWIYNKFIGGLGSAFRDTIKENEKSFASTYTTYYRMAVVGTKEIRSKCISLWGESN